MWIGHHKEIRKLMTFRALALRCCGEGLTLETSVFESHYSGQFPLSTQLIKSNYLHRNPHRYSTTHSFFRNLPLYSFNVQHCHLRLFCSVTWQANMVRLSLGKTPYSHSTKWGMGTSEVNAGATVQLTNRGTKWGVTILLVALRYRNQDTGFSLGDQLACMKALPTYLLVFPGMF